MKWFIYGIVAIPAGVGVVVALPIFGAVGAVTALGAAVGSAGGFITGAGLGALADAEISDITIEKINAEKKAEEERKKAEASEKKAEEERKKADFNERRARKAEDSLKDINDHG